MFPLVTYACTANRDGLISWMLDVVTRLQAGSRQATRQNVRAIFVYASFALQCKPLVFCYLDGPAWVYSGSTDI